MVCGLLLLLSVTIFRYQLNQKFEAKCDKIRAAGEPITLKELSEFYGEVPDEENAALIYEDIFSLYKDSDAVYDMYVKEMTDKGIPEENREFKDKSSFLNTLPFEGYGSNLVVGNELPEKVKIATRMFLNANKRCLELSRQTEQYSKCQFNLDFNKGFEMLLPHLAPSKAYARLLAVDINYASFIGYSDRVLKDFREGMKLGIYLLNEPICVSYAASDSINKVLIDALKIGYSRVQFSNLQLQEIENIIKENINSMGEYRMYIGERVFSLIVCDKLPKLFTLSPTNKIIYKFVPFFGLDTLWKLKLLDLFDVLLKIEREKNISKKYKLFTDLQKKYNNLSFIYRIIKFIIPFSLMDSRFKVIAKLTTALIAVKIERYRIKYHKLPKDLNALVPEFFETLPVDPFSGKSYKYRVGKFYASLKNGFNDSVEKKLDGFVVYSVGINGVDDKGEDEEKHGDIVYWVIGKKNINKL